MNLKISQTCRIRTWAGFAVPVFIMKIVIVYEDLDPCLVSWYFFSTSCLVPVCIGLLSNFKLVF